MVRMECPFCSEIIKSEQPGPRSAVTQRVIQKRNKHIKEEHPDRLEEYKNILELYEKREIGRPNTVLEAYKKLYEELKQMKNPFQSVVPSDIKIVKEYNSEELSDKDDAELEEIGREY
jgi:hypothetical protein